MSALVDLLRDWITILLVCGGVVFFIAGAVGMLRFPDSITRLHALTKADNLGLGLIMLGLLPQVAWPFGALKLVTIWALVLLASATATQLVGRVAMDEAEAGAEAPPNAAGDASGEAGAHSIAGATSRGPDSPEGPEGMERTDR